MRKLFLSLAVLMLVGAGCSSETTSSGALVGTSVGDAAPAFSIETVDGPFSLSEKEGTVVIMTSMASWCPTCKVEAKQLRIARDQLAEQNVEFLSISIDPTDNKEKIRAFQEELGTPWSYAGLFSDPAVQRMIIDYKMTQREKTYVIDPSGVIVYTDGGISVADKIVQAAKSAL